MDLGLSLHDAAPLVGCHWKTLVDWERDRKVPRPRKFPGIITFLGYDPEALEVSLGERLKAKRERQGLSIHALGKILGVAPSTVRFIERGTRPIKRRVIRAIEEFLVSE